MYAGFYWRSPCHTSPVHPHCRREMKQEQQREGGGVSAEGGHCLILEGLHFGNGSPQTVNTSFLGMNNRWNSMIICYCHCPSVLLQIVRLWNLPHCLTLFHGCLLLYPYSHAAYLTRKHNSRCSWPLHRICLSSSGNIHKLRYLSPNFQHDL